MKSGKVKDARLWRLVRISRKLKKMVLNSNKTLTFPLFIGFGPEVYPNIFHEYANPICSCPAER